MLTTGFAMNVLSSQDFPAQPPASLDALLPPEMATRAEQIGVKKAALGTVSLWILGILAGAFIALGAILYTTAITGAAGVLRMGSRDWSAARPFAWG